MTRDDELSLSQVPKFSDQDFEKFSRILIPKP